MDGGYSAKKVDTELKGWYRAERMVQYTRLEGSYGAEWMLRDERMVHRAERIVPGCRDVTGLIGDTGLKGWYRAERILQG